jgi:hypothetical protein
VAGRLLGSVSSSAVVDVWIVASERVYDTELRGASVRLLPSTPVYAARPTSVESHSSALLPGLLLVGLVAVGGVVVAVLD